MAGFWEEIERRGPGSVLVDGIELAPGARVRLRPRAGGDIFDIALAGRVAVVESIEQDVEGELTVAVVVEDDPGSDLGFARQPGHRFFFAPGEVEPLGDAPGRVAPAIDGSGIVAEAPPADPRILVAGIGNVFLGDDGFGVALAERLGRDDVPGGVDVAEFGVRGMDLAFAMQDGYDAVVFLDATPRGEAPGTLYAIEVQDDDEDGAGVFDAHGMDPVKVLALVRLFGGIPPPTFVIGCEPQTRMSAEDEEIVAELSEPMQAALEPGVKLVQSLLADIGERFRQQEERS